MSKLLGILAILGLLLTILTGRPAAAAQSGSILKILSLNFNSETTSNDDHHVLRDIRFSAMVDWVHRNDPDIILLQEGWNYGKDSSVAITLARVIGYDVAYRLDMGFPGFMYDSDAVLAKKNLRMSEEKDIKLPHSAWDIGDGKHWLIVTGGVSYGVGVKLTLPNGEPLYAYSTHLVATSEADRKDQIAYLDRAIQKQVRKDNRDWNNTKVIIAGDMNSGPDSPGQTYLRSQGYQDTFAEAHPGDTTSCTNCTQFWGPTYNPLTLGAAQFPSQNLIDIDKRLDFIYTRGPGLKTLASRLEFTEPWDGIWMSDHYGVVTTLAVDGDPSEGTLPNPLLAAGYVSPPATFINLTKALFKAGQLPPLEVKSPRGITFRAGRGGDVNIHLRGPGNIFTAPNTELSDGQYASFTFDRPGIYTYRIDNDDSRQLTGSINVTKGFY